MFKLATQDGRTICIDRKFTLFVSGYLKSSNQPAAVTVSTFDKATSDIVERFGVVAVYSTDTEFINASKALRRAWNNGEKSFTMPADFATRDRDEAFAEGLNHEEKVLPRMRRRYYLFAIRSAQILLRRVRR